MGRERNQRSAESSRKIGIRKTATPNTCNARSLTMAPKTPIQLCAGRPAGGFDAVFSEGSSGEYETSARTRRTAKTKTRKPISSLSRRLAVGVNVRATMFILTYGFAAEPRRCLGLMLPAPASFGAGRHHRPTRSEPNARFRGSQVRQSQNDYPKKAGGRGEIQEGICCQSSLSPK